MKTEIYSQEQNPGVPLAKSYIVYIYIYGLKVSPEVQVPMYLPFSNFDTSKPSQRKEWLLKASCLPVAVLPGLEKDTQPPKLILLSTDPSQG